MRQSTGKTAKIVDDFNAKHPVGTAVKYHPVVDELGAPVAGHNSLVTRTSSEAWAEGGRALIFVTGKSGYVALRNVEVIS